MLLLILTAGAPAPLRAIVVELELAQMIEEGRDDAGTDGSSGLGKLRVAESGEETALDRVETVSGNGLRNLADEFFLGDVVLEEDTGELDDRGFVVDVAKDIGECGEEEGSLLLSEFGDLSFGGMSDVGVHTDDGLKKTDKT